MVARFKVLTWFSCANLESFVIGGPNVMIILADEGIEDPNTACFKWAIIGLPAKRH